TARRVGGGEGRGVDGPVDIGDVVGVRRRGAALDVFDARAGGAVVGTHVQLVPGGPFVGRVEDVGAHGGELGWVRRRASGHDVNDEGLETLVRHLPQLGAEGGLEGVEHQDPADVDQVVGVRAGGVVGGRVDVHVVKPCRRPIAP